MDIPEGWNSIETIPNDTLVTILSVTGKIREARAVNLMWDPVKERKGRYCHGKSPSGNHSDLTAIAWKPLA